MLEHALAYAMQGYNIIPVGRDKKPIISEWKHFQTSPADLTQVQDWWTERPTANIAAICGRHSGFFVVDIDPGADISGLALPPTKIVRTGRGGFHYYYKWQECLASVPNTVGIRPHVDLRGEGSYVLVPPSVNENGAYELIVDDELADLPPSILPPPRRQNGSWQERLKGVQAGSRNASAASIIGGLTKAMPPLYWEDTVWPFIEWWNIHRATPPMDRQELQRTFNSICTRSLNSNWSSWVK